MRWGFGSPALVRLDRYFDEKSEASLNHAAIAKLASDDFSPVSCRYMGGPAYFLIYNSLLFRLPMAVKRNIRLRCSCSSGYLQPPAGLLVVSVFVARWQRTKS